MASPESAQRPQFNLSEEPVTILVGPEKKRFILHPSPLRYSSRLFQVALSDQWRESKDKEVSLKEVFAVDFNFYACYCYGGNIDAGIKKKLDDNDKDDKNHDSDVFDHLARMYILGDIHLDDKSFRNHVMDKILDLATAGANTIQPSSSTICMICDSVSENSTLMRFLLDDCITGTGSVWLEEHYEELPTAFAKKIMMAWAQAVKDKNFTIQKPTQVARCLYHEHSPGDSLGPTCSALPASPAPKTPQSKTPQSASLRLTRKRRAAEIDVDW